MEDDMTHIRTERPRHLGCWPKHLDCGHRDYIGREVTLDGLPAIIIVDNSGHAFVYPSDPEGLSWPYSWTTVFDVCDNHGGRF